MKVLNVDTMKEALINYAHNQEEMDAIWDALYMMRGLDFIDHNTWKKFYEECMGWYFDEENNCVRDCHSHAAHKDAIVWEYREGAVYIA